MKIKNKLMKNFLKRIYLNGVVSKCVFNFKEEGLEVQMKNESNTIGIVGFIGKDVFENYQAINKRTLANIDELLKMCGEFQETIEIIPEYNDELDEDKKDVSRIVFKSENIKDNYYSPVGILESIENKDLTESINNISYDEEISSELDEFKIALRKRAILDKDGIRMEIQNDELVCYIGDIEDIVKNIGRYCQQPIKLDKPVQKVYKLNFGIYFIKVLEVLETKTTFKISENTDLPLIVENEDEGVKFKYVLMPSDD